MQRRKSKSFAARSGYRGAAEIHRGSGIVFSGELSTGGRESFFPENDSRPLCMAGLALSDRSELRHISRADPAVGENDSRPPVDDGSAAQRDLLNSPGPHLADPAIRGPATVEPGY